MNPSAPPSATPGRRLLGRFDVRILLGKSRSMMNWLATDVHSGHEVMLVLPRTQPATPEVLDEWLDRARRAARLRHPQLAPAMDIGAEEHWPYLAIDRSQGITLAEYLAGTAAPAPVDVGGWMIAVLEGLAYAHEAGLWHGDLQLHHVLIDDRGAVRLAAVGLGDVENDLLAGLMPEQAASSLANERAMPVDPARLGRQRAIAAVDLLGCGALLHRLLSGEAPLGQADLMQAVARLPPRGREPLRLPWTTPHPIPEALRAIANRSTDRQPRQRYLSARGMVRALQGWLEAMAREDGGALALLLDRLPNVGHLPGMPGVVDRVARLALDDQQRTQEIAEQVLQDVALTLELLRQVNTAEVRGSQVSGNGPVLTLRRAVALVGLRGVRQAALALRPWPGPLDEAGAKALASLLDRVRLAAFTAQAIRPAGYDPDVVFLLATMQNLGRLLIQYHFPTEAAQIRQLMKALPPTTPDGRPEPGLDEREASFAVLGVDLEEIGPAVARHWGLTDEVSHMIRRLSTERPVFNPDTDADLIRAAASAGNEAVDALASGDASRVGRDLQRVAQRYARVLSLKPGDLQEALQAARAQTRSTRISGTSDAAAADPGPSATAAPRPPAATSAGAAVPGAPGESALRRRAKEVTSLTPGTESTVRAASFPT
jgi:eukaryotic-like serine/threonine-protein kinase